MSFKIINDNLSLGINLKNGQEYLNFVSDDTKPEIWITDENGFIKSRERDLYIDVDNDGIFIRPLIKEKVSQMWYYDRGRICNIYNSDWVLGSENVQLIAGQILSTPKASQWKCIPLDTDSDMDKISDYEDVEEDDFVIVPIPDCFDQNLPPSKEATKVVVVKSKDKIISTFATKKSSASSSVFENDMSKNINNFNKSALDIDNNRKTHNIIQTDSSSINGNNCPNTSSKSICVDDVISNADVLKSNDDVNDVKSDNATDIVSIKDLAADEIDNHLDLFEDAYDNLEASTLRVITSAFSIANNIFEKTVSVAKDVFYTLQAKDCQGDEQNNKAWCPPKDKWIPKVSTWEPKKNLWMPQDQCWMPEEGPWSPDTTPWTPKKELWMPKEDVWMPKEGPMEKLFEMGFTDRRKNQELLDKYKNFDEVLDRLFDVKDL